MIRISSFRGLNKNNVLRKLYSVIAVTGTNTLIKPKFPHFFVLFLILCYGGGGKISLKRVASALGVKILTNDVVQWNIRLLITTNHIKNHIKS